MEPLKRIKIEQQIKEDVIMKDDDEEEPKLQEMLPNPKKKLFFSKSKASHLGKRTLIMRKPWEMEFSALSL